MEEPTATSEQTIEALLDLSAREELPLASSFVQGRTGRNKPRPGPLAAFVSAGHERALAQYLLLHAAASGGDWSVARDSRVWARAMGLNPASASARSAVSKNWAWLEKEQLVKRSRKGRLSNVTLRRDDGSGRTYAGHPAERAEPYLRVPYALWRDGWHRQLDLTGLAVLLIALDSDDGFKLPREHMPGWYGISGSTVTKGIKRLRNLELIDVRRNKKTAPLAPDGYTWEHSYTLKPPFGPKADRSARKRPHRKKRKVS